MSLWDIGKDPKTLLRPDCLHSQTQSVYACRPEAQLPKFFALRHITL